MTTPNHKSLLPAAISLSGGGGRAAGFHLGVLSYLDHLDLLKDISIISSVSGGTFTAAKYALTLKTAPEGEDLHETFRRFSREFRNFLINANLVPKALKRLSGKPGPATPFKQRTVVKALADVYDNDKSFMNRELFGVFWQGRDIHLKDIIFNASECKNSDAFRFQKSRKKDVQSGSDLIPIETEHAKQIRMADIVAASSDIPVGLEPLLFPVDFVWPKDQPNICKEIQDDLKGKADVDTLALMDGGVVDNQGIESVLKAAHEILPAHDDPSPVKDQVKYVEESFIADIPFEDELGLYIISDVPLLTESSYQPEPKSPPGEHLTVRRIANLLRGLFLIACVSGVSLIGHAVYTGRVVGDVILDLESIFLYGFPLVLVASLVGSLLWLRKEIRDAMQLAAPVSPHLWKHLKKLTLSDVRFMLGIRLSSTWALTSSIYFARIRDLMYHILYSVDMPSRDDESESTGGKFSDRLVPVDDYMLMRNHDHLPPELQPTKAMREIASCCSHMPTTLWLTEEQSDDLMMCGQMTVCFKLLDNFRPRVENAPDIQELVEKVRADWEEFKNNPRFILDGLKEPYNEKPKIRKSMAAGSSS